MPQPQPINENLLKSFTWLITNHTGIEIRERDKNALSEKILLRMKALKFKNAENYYKLLKALTPESYQEWKIFITLITNIESYFFRDQEQFLLLRNYIIPELIQQKELNKTIRICSAGCSSGEEPYSLAILLKELLPNLEEWNVTILGIDINQEAIQKAKTGIYRLWSFRRVDTEIVQQYFQVINNEYHLNSSIKQMVKFQAINLVKDSFPQPNSELQELDLIICRNVFIYFESSAIANVLNKFYDCLRPLGYLITGHSELYGQNLSQFQTKVFPESVVYQRIANQGSDRPRETLFQASIHPSENLSWELNNHDIVTALENSNVKMQQTALNLLKQLPPETPIAKMGNMTAAELIAQLETTLNLRNF